MPGPKPRPVVKRFQEKILVNEKTGCWEWTGHVKPNGYAQFWDNGKKYAHRVSYELHIGPALEGMDVCHTCDNRKCVNPDHLFLGTRQDNMNDMVGKGRGMRGERHCNSKLNEREVLAIREMCRRHPTKRGNGGNGVMKFLSGWFGMSKTQISCVGNGKTWRHI